MEKNAQIICSNQIHSRKVCLNIEFSGSPKPFLLHEHFKIQVFKIYLADSDTKLILIGQKMSIIRVCLKKFCLNPKSKTIHK